MAQLPHFLIIGAMKAGTTTLYRDLHGHPAVFLPEEKEPDTLVRFADDDVAVRADYANLFRQSRSDQRLGEASTSYTKRPDYTGVAERALRICGPDLRLIYLQRDPAKRLLSHYEHDFGQGRISMPLAQAIQEYSRYADYSSYEWQLEPWRRAFGESNLLILEFEHYVTDRLKTLERVCGFLDLNPAELPPPQINRAFNASAEKPVARGLARKVLEAPFYQRRMKPLIPWQLRDRLNQAFLPKAPRSGATLDAATKAQVHHHIEAHNASVRKARN